MLHSLALLLLAASSAVGASPKVFGVGLSKTGTTSLAAALTELGLVTVHSDRAFAPYLSADPAAYNYKRYDAVDAVVDLPTAPYYAELYAAYPDAKFILTQRGEEAWYRSFAAHDAAYRAVYGGVLPARLDRLHAAVYGSATPERETWLASYRAYNAAVQAFFADKPGSLLVANFVDSEDGYAELCTFLDRADGPCATSPRPAFPHLNSAGTIGGAAAGLPAPLIAERAAACAAREAREAMISTGATMAPRRAFVWALDKPATQDRHDYFLSTLVSMRSVLQADPVAAAEADLVLLVHGDLTPAQTALLDALRVKVVPVGTVGRPLSHGLGAFSEGLAAAYRLKLRALELVEYDRVAFLDADVLVTAPLTDLMASPRLLAAAGRVSPLNAGVFFVAPSCAAWADIADAAHADAFTPAGGWFESGKLKDWREGAEAGAVVDWSSFYGGDVDQGLLYWRYFLLVPGGGEVVGVTAWNRRITHFVGSHKPWLIAPEGVAQVPRRFRDATAAWFDTLANLQAVVDAAIVSPHGSAALATQRVALAGVRALLAPARAVSLTAEDAARIESAVERVIASEPKAGAVAVGHTLAAAGSSLRGAVRPAPVPPSLPAAYGRVDDPYGSYTPSEALQSLYFAAAAYCPAANLQKWNCAACNRVPKFGNVTVCQDSQYTLQAYVGQFLDSGTTVVAFRGTEPTSLENWIEDLKNAVKTSYSANGCNQCNVGLGFYQAYLSLKSCVFTAVNRLGAHEAPIFLTGHSLGGAMAAFAAADLVGSNYNLARYYTFGEPRTGDANWASFFSQSVGTSAFRVVHWEDIVPHLPPELLSFQHSPVEVFYQEQCTYDTNYKVCSSSNGEDPTCSDQFLLPDSISDHLVYLNLPISNMC